MDSRLASTIVYSHVRCSSEYVDALSRHQVGFSLFHSLVVVYWSAQNGRFDASLGAINRPAFYMYTRLDINDELKEVRLAYGDFRKTQRLLAVRLGFEKQPTVNKSLQKHTCIHASVPSIH